MSVIWIFREPRTGGTWFSDHVASSLGFKQCFISGTVAGIDSDLGFDSDYFLNEVKRHPLESTVFNTHFFTGLKLLDHFENPILIRCIRRDKTEQFLSHWLIKMAGYQFTNLIHDENYEKYKELFEKATQQQIIVPKKYVDEYMQVRISNERLWEQYATKYENFTVYYEDLCENGVDIPSINLYNCKITSEGITSKLPEYKTKVFLNRDMIQNWIDEYNL